MSRGISEVTAGQAPAVEASIGQRMAKGAFWMVLARALDRSIGLASTIILARLLVPEDFGLVAMATALLALLEVFGAFGVDMALIQNTSATDRHLDTAWTFNVIQGAAFGLALLALAGPAADFYSEPRLQAIILCLAAGSLIQGFENIGTVMFRKELRFQQEFTLLFCRRLAGFLVTIPVAFVLRSYWALVAGMLMGRVAAVALSYALHEYRPRFSFAALRELLHFGKWLVVSNTLYFITSRCADFVIGKTSGAHALGLFNLSYEISNLPTSDLIAPINRAIFPGYAQKANQLDALRDTYLQVIGVVALLAVPAGVGIAAVAEILVPVVLGPKWVEAVPAMTALSFFGVLLALKTNNHYVYLALGKSRIPALLALLQLVILLPLVVVGSMRGGAHGAAIAYLAAQLLFTPISVGMIRHVLKLRVGQLAAVFYRPLIAAAAMYVGTRFAVVAFEDAPRYGASLIVPLLICVSCGVALYAVGVLLLWWVAGRPASAESRTLEFARAKARGSFHNIFPGSRNGH
jgi:lipopolysaccharide exporter